MVNGRALLTCLISVAITAPVALGANYHFVFGDSFSATGFNPAGTLPNSANPIGNPAFPGATYPAGITNWIGYLTATYNNSQVFTYDYANDGSTVDNDILQYTGLPDLKDKVDVFLNTVGSQPPSTPWTSSNALFTFWVGNYDAPGTYGKADPIGLSNQLLDAYFAQADRLYAVGARKFLFVTVAPIDRAPWAAIIPASQRPLVASYITGYNSRLSTRIAAYATKPGVTVYKWDAWTQFTNTLDNLSSYGFAGAGPGTPAANYFWGDGYNPGITANNQFAQFVRSNVLGAGFIF